MKPGAGLVVVAAALAAWLAAPAARACGATTDCRIATGDYRILLPEPARRAASHGAIVYLHGYRGSPDEIMKFDALRQVAEDLGVAVIAPRGLDGEWGLPEVQKAPRDDIAFVRAVVDDAVARFAIDAQRILVTGFSLGASMTWYIACAEGRRYAGYAPIAGAFWEPYVKNCRLPLPEIHHVHGRADRTVPLGGRALSFATQGDTYASFELLRELIGCSAPLVGEQVDGELTCARQECSGAAQELCLHDGGHGVEPAWIARAWGMVFAND
jgi:polyhydroxybutyrate depolymerase